MFLDALQLLHTLERGGNHVVVARLTHAEVLWASRRRFWVNLPLRFSKRMDEAYSTGTAVYSSATARRTDQSPHNFIYRSLCVPGYELMLWAARQHDTAGSAARLYESHAQLQILDLMPAGVFMLEPKTCTTPEFMQQAEAPLSTSELYGLLQAMQADTWPSHIIDSLHELHWERPPTRAVPARSRCSSPSTPNESALFPASPAFEEPLSEGDLSQTDLGPSRRPSAASLVNHGRLSPPQSLLDAVHSQDITSHLQIGNSPVEYASSPGSTVFYEDHGWPEFTLAPVMLAPYSSDISVIPLHLGGEVLYVSTEPGDAAFYDGPSLAPARNGGQ